MLERKIQLQRTLFFSSRPINLEKVTYEKMSWGRGIIKVKVQKSLYIFHYMNGS